MIENFKFGKYWLSQFGGRLLDVPKIEIAQRAFNIIDIPGRDGSSFVDYGYYKNVEFERKIGLISTITGSTSTELIDSLINWLAYSVGYQEFRDTQHNGCYTKAILTNFEEISRELRVYSTATLKFNRKPAWKADSGTQILTYTGEQIFNGIELYNPYLLNAKPKIIFYTKNVKASNIYFWFNDKQSTFIKATGYSALEVDFENLNAISKNSETDYTVIDGTFGETLQAGKNIFKVYKQPDTNNPVTKIDIIPNWRRL